MIFANPEAEFDEIFNTSGNPTNEILYSYTLNSNLTSPTSEKVFNISPNDRTQYYDTGWEIGESLKVYNGTTGEDITAYVTIDTGNGPTYDIVYTNDNNASVTGEIKIQYSSDHISSGDTLKVLIPINLYILNISKDLFGNEYSNIFESYLFTEVLTFTSNPFN